MGPILLLDKSILQQISAKESTNEILILFRHYLVVVPPVLVMEILGDLTKPTEEGRFSKRDLSWVHSEWEPLSAEARRERMKQYGYYPPENASSITYQLWKKHMKPKGPGEVRLIDLMSNEQKQELVEQMKALIEGKSLPEGKYGKPSGDFLMVK